MDHVLEDPGLNLDIITGEYATLLRVARSASQDSGAGNLIENIVVSENSIMIARSVPPDHYLLLLCNSQDQIGRARYELKRASWELNDPGL